MMRSTVFLFFFSFFTALIAGLLLVLFFRNTELSSDKIMSYYDSYVPAFQATFDGKNLSSEPQRFGLYFASELGKFEPSQEKTEESSFALEVDTGRSMGEIVSDSLLLNGVYALRDGVFVREPSGSRVISYADMEFQLPVAFTFTKQSLGGLFKNFIPTLLEFLWKFISLGGFLVVFFYLFLIGWLKALVFSLLGMVVLLIMKKKIHYGFLLRLSFYASLPAFVFWIITLLTSTTVPLLPTLVYLGYYGYGLSVYRPS